MEHTTDFTRGPIVGPLLRFSLPILLALFLQALYGAVDLLVVGKYAMAQDVSGVAVGSQIMGTITNLVSSFAMGIRSERAIARMAEGLSARVSFFSFRWGHCLRHLFR